MPPIHKDCGRKVFSSGLIKQEGESGLQDFYAGRQQHLNPMSFKQEYDLSKIENIQAKISEMEEQIAKITGQLTSKVDEYESRIVTSDSDIVRLSNEGWKF